MKTHVLKIQTIIQETSNTKSFLLKSISGEINYLPGQFLTLLHPHSKMIRRSYSLSSHPLFDQEMRITVKRIPNGEYSRWLFDQAKVGDEIETIGASGFFTLPESLPLDVTLFFIAAGSGITPVFSLMKEVLLQRKQKVVLIYSNRSQHEAIFYQQLLELENQFSSRLKIHFLFSEDKNLILARLSKSLLAQFLNEVDFDKSKALAYLCGPHDYMQMVQIVLLNENFLPENIRTEKFNTDNLTTKELPPDTEGHQVKVKFQGKEFLFDVKFPTTILQTAKRQNIDLPYSCEAGRCGTCAATCVTGKIWMSRNEVLLDKEIAKGRVLTCTGYPVGGDADLVID